MPFRWRSIGKLASKSLALCVVTVATLMSACGSEHGGSAPLDPNPVRVIGAAAGRPATVVLPADYDVTRQYPLVILLHGYGVNGLTQDFIFGLAERTTQYQFIVVLPDGTLNSNGERFWDATPECCNFSGSPIDDVGYLASLMEEAGMIYAVDERRIRLVGHSNGGYMSYRYICEHPVPVDRIAVLAGSTYLDAVDCLDPRPVDVLHIHGTSDDTVPYPPSTDQGLETIGAEAAVARWAAIDGCSEGLELVGRRDYHQRIRVGDDPAETEVYRARDCRSGRSVELWKAVGADHLFLSVTNGWRDDVAAFLSE